MVIVANVPYIWHYIHAWMVVHILTCDNESLLSVANNLMCVYQNIFCLITQ